MSETEAKETQELLGLTTEIVAAYVSNNPVAPGDLGKLITDTHASLRALDSASTPVPEEKPVPAVSIRKSVTPDFLICLEDGKQFKSLKRHLATHYNLTPQQYRERWGLPADYPMVAPSYSATRSALAKTNGLGRKSEPVTEPAKRNRKKIGLSF